MVASCLNLGQIYKTGQDMHVVQVTTKLGVWPKPIWPTEYQKAANEAAPDRLAADGVVLRFLRTMSFSSSCFKQRRASGSRAVLRAVLSNRNESERIRSSLFLEEGRKRGENAADGGEIADEGLHGDLLPVSPPPPFSLFTSCGWRRECRRALATTSAASAYSDQTSRIVDGSRSITWVGEGDV
jgi:hypothetical protein